MVVVCVAYATATHTAIGACKKSFVCGNFHVQFMHSMQCATLLLSFYFLCLSVAAKSLYSKWVRSILVCICVRNMPPVRPQIHKSSLWVRNIRGGKTNMTCSQADHVACTTESIVVARFFCSCLVLLLLVQLELIVGGRYKRMYRNTAYSDKAEGCPTRS